MRSHLVHWRSHVQVTQSLLLHSEKENIIHPLSLLAGIAPTNLGTKHRIRVLQEIAHLQKIPNEGAIAAATPCPSNASPIRLDTVIAIQERSMSVLVSDEILQAANMSDADLKRELAILLYQQKKLGISKARELA